MDDGTPFLLFIITSLSSMYQMLDRATCTESGKAEGTSRKAASGFVEVGLGAAQSQPGRGSMPWLRYLHLPIHHHLT